jgi:twitching motility two-component system response regulator PilH
MRGQAARVWVLDDEADVVSYLVAAMEDAGYEARGFAASRTLFAALDQEPTPDVICLDILLPEESGLSVYRTLRGRLGLDAVPIIMVSGYSRREEFEAGEFQRLMGNAPLPPPDGFIEKPVALPELLALVERLVHRADDAAQGSATKERP